MKTCKDCIHDKLCDEWAVTSGMPFVNADTCQHYKNKADFVKVVRCGKCKYRITQTCPITGTESLFCDYGINPVAVEPTHYCGYGEKGR